MHRRSKRRIGLPVTPPGGLSGLSSLTAHHSGRTVSRRDIISAASSGMPNTVRSEEATWLPGNATTQSACPIGQEVLTTASVPRALSRTIPSQLPIIDTGSVFWHATPPSATALQNITNRRLIRHQQYFIVIGSASILSLAKSRQCLAPVLRSKPGLDADRNCKRRDLIIHLIELASKSLLSVFPPRPCSLAICTTLLVDNHSHICLSSHNPASPLTPQDVPRNWRALHKRGIIRSLGKIPLLQWASLVVRRNRNVSESIGAEQRTR